MNARELIYRSLGVTSHLSSEESRRAAAISKLVWIVVPKDQPEDSPHRHALHYEYSYVAEHIIDAAVASISEGEADALLGDYWYPEKSSRAHSLEDAAYQVRARVAGNDELKRDPRYEINRAGECAVAVLDKVCAYIEEHPFDD